MGTGAHQSHSDASSGEDECLCKVSWQSNPIVVGIFHSGPQVDGLIDRWLSASQKDLTATSLPRRSLYERLIIDL